MNLRQPARIPSPFSGRGAAIFRCRLVVACLFLAVTAGLPGATSPVSVIKTVPRIVRRSYDPLNPPAEMTQKLTLPEAGLCESEFGCEIYTGTAMPAFGLRTVQATITSIRLILHLQITIWTVTASTPKLLAHEEGHRRLNEEYYRNAAEIAYRLAAQALGKKLPVTLRSRGKSKTGAVEAFQSTLLAEYLEATARRSTVAQKRFDAITAHGGNAIPEDAAMLQALTEHPPGK